MILANCSLCLITPRPLPLREMELELSLGDSPAPVKPTMTPAPAPTRMGGGEGHDLVLGLGVKATERSEQDNQKTGTQQKEAVEGEDDEARPWGEPPVEVSPSYPLRPASAQTGSVNSEAYGRGYDVNTVLVDGRASTARSLSPKCMQVEVPVREAVDQEASEDEENGGGRVRKKLRLSKEQSAFLEDSFKEHSTLTTEQKRNLANRLSLQPRQVEVWFQNRRARTKLKQTEVDREYLKRYCEMLTQENRRLQREVAELHAFRPAYPLYNNNHHHHLSGVSTALRACPSCGNKATTYYPPPTVTTHAAITAVSPPRLAASRPSTMSTLFARPHFVPFAVHPVLRRQSSATS